MRQPANKKQSAGSEGWREQNLGCQVPKPARGVWRRLGKMECNREMDTRVLIAKGSSPSLLNDSSPLLWQKFEKKFQSEKAAGPVSKSTQFEYAWCLVRSKYNDDIRKGIALLEGEVPGCPHSPSQLPSGSVFYCHWASFTPSNSSAGTLCQHGPL